ncbi:MAG: ABC transporter permease [Clostridiales bacterium]|jgi:ABC-2 type transport system permease protein|nr:ABC transporter permease [Clostridiales bacterium]
MRSVKAMFVKQTLDMFRNWPVLIQYVVYPAVAFVFTVLVAKADETIADTMFVAMFSSIFAGMALVFSAMAVIAEDRETKSLRFLVMAGVKPHEYLIGVGGVIFLFGLGVSVVFALIGGYSGAEFFKFLLVMVLGSAASILLGASIGILSKNQQSASAVGIPVSMVLGFAPMVTMFNETAKQIFDIFYTQQVNVVANDVSTDIARPVLIILANIAALAALFAAAYRKKRLG